MSKPTIKSIASLAGVSIGTVDRALHGRGRINPDTQRRVTEAAASLGYHPNKMASALSRQRKCRIAAITPANPPYFQHQMQRGIVDAQKELADFGVDVDILLCDRLVPSDQLHLLENLDREKYDGVALNASGDALNPAINALVDGGIPVVTFNSDARRSKRLFFVGEDAYNSGQLSGDMMGLALGGKGTVTAMLNSFSPSASLNRYLGFCDVLRKHYPGIVIADPWEYRDSDDLAQDAVAQAFEFHPEINGVFANSATGTRAAGAYVDAKGLAGRVAVIGYDVTEDVERFLLNGSCTMIIDQDPRKQSYYGVSLLAKHLLENWLPKERELEIRVKMVMRYNAAEHSMKSDERGVLSYIASQNTVIGNEFLSI